MMCNAGQLMGALSCPVGWSSYSSYCYYVSGAGIEVNWTIARSRCQSLNAELVSIDDNAENLFVKSILYANI